MKRRNRAIGISPFDPRLTPIQENRANKKPVSKKREKKDMGKVAQMISQLHL